MATARRRAVPESGVSGKGFSFAPIVHNLRAPPVKPRFKVVAFNAHGGKHVDAIAERLRQPPFAGASVMLVSELDWRLRRSGGRETAADLADRLSMSFAFGPEYGFPHANGQVRSYRGNAILSSAPLLDVRVVPITSLYDWTRHHLANVREVHAIGARAGLLATIDIAGKKMTVGVAHLERRTTPAGRAMQMDELLSEIPDGPALIGGDLNTTTVEMGSWRAVARLVLTLLCEPRRFSRAYRYEPLFERLGGAGFTVESVNQPTTPTYTFSRLVPRFIRPRLDWIAIRGLMPISGSAQAISARNGLGRRLSDHDFIACELQL